MPLDPTFYVAISFLIFMIFLGRPIIKLVFQGLDNRAKDIKSQIDKALEVLNNAQKLLQATKTQRKETLEQIKAIKTHADFEAERLKSEGRKKLEQVLEREEALATEQIARAERQAMEDIRRKAVHLAVDASEKMLERVIKEKENEHLIDLALNEIEQLDFKIKKPV